MINYACNPRIRVAANIIWAGGIVAYPTEAVWGLGCDPFNAAAVEKILLLKRRPVSKGLILVAADINMFAPFLSSLSAEQRRTLTRSWPAPVTWLVPNNGAVPLWITGGQPTLALRVTTHPVAAGLSRAVGGAIVSTSANPGGFPEASTLTKVKAYFGDNVDAYAPGKVGSLGRPTEIRDLVSGHVVRSSNA